MAAGNILRDAGGARTLQLDMQGLYRRLNEALERKELEAELGLANGILSDSLRIEGNVVADCDFKPLTNVLLGQLNDHPACVAIHQAAIKIAEEAFELGRRAVEQTVELHAITYAERLAEMAKPNFLEVDVL